jgi:predicted RNase H-like nuclease
MRVMGLDACKGGWIGVVLDDGRFEQATYLPSVLVSYPWIGSIDVHGVDMPIGLPAGDAPRAADLAARASLGRRRSTIFLAPQRAAFRSTTYAQARIGPAGRGLTAQAFALRAKILEIEEWIERGADNVYEVHPELSFLAMRGGPAIQAPKKTWAGAMQRRQLLADVGVELPDDLGREGEKAAVDDVLDAAAVAWSAQRIATGQARSLPDPPEVIDGRQVAIWA